MEIEINPLTITWPVYASQIPIIYRSRRERKTRRVKPIEKVQEYNKTRSSTEKNLNSLDLLV